VPGGAGVERGEPGGRAQGDAGTAGPEGIVPAERLPAAAGAGGSGGLPAELVEGALARARLRERGLPVEGLAPEARERLSDELIDERSPAPARRRRSSARAGSWAS
jgi:hypothetical protein